MTKKQVTEIAESNFHKIVDYYGFSKFHGTTPYLEIDISPFADSKTDSFGEYNADDNSIVIYWPKMKTNEDIIRTIIHEYQHYLQSKTWYTRYSRMYDYSTNPYEIAAYKAESAWVIFQ